MSVLYPSKMALLKISCFTSFSFWTALFRSILSVDSTLTRDLLPYSSFSCSPPSTYRSFLITKSLQFKRGILRFQIGSTVDFTLARSSFSRPITELNCSPKSPPAIYKMSSWTTLCISVALRSVVHHREVFDGDSLENNGVSDNIAKTSAEHC